MPAPTFTSLHLALQQLLADAEAFQAENKGTNYASDAVAGLCDALRDCEAEFVEEIPTGKDTGRLWATTDRRV